MFINAGIFVLLVILQINVTGSFQMMMKDIGGGGSVGGREGNGDRVGQTLERPFGGKNGNYRDTLRLKRLEEGKIQPKDFVPKYMSGHVVRKLRQ